MRLWWTAVIAVMLSLLINISRVVNIQVAKIFNNVSNIRITYSSVENNVERVQDINYTETNEYHHQMDVYLRSNESDFSKPWCIFVHGGGWLFGDRKNSFAR